MGDGMNREGAADRRWVRCGSLWMVRYAASDSSIARGVRSCTRGARVAACPDRGPFVREAVHRGRTTAPTGSLHDKIGRISDGEGGSENGPPHRFAHGGIIMGLRIAMAACS